MRFIQFDMAAPFRMAYYFKKQEEMKRMAESNEDDYLHSSWADPKQLQRSLRGQGDIRAPGLR
jgi:hypothetical protein